MFAIAKEGDEKSATGKAFPLFPSTPNAIKKYLPGSIKPERAIWLSLHLFDPLPAYCNDQPARLTLLAVGLYNSTKSLLKGAPVFPPPPYTWLMTT
nr:hypothetical protein [Pseudocnuella soli]